MSENNNTVPSITAIILTLNEERNIKNCIDHLRWARRIIVVDSGSTDNTVDVATAMGCDIYFNSWPGFASQRNWAFQNTEIDTQWVLFVDADEEVTKPLQEEICEKLISTSNVAYYLCFKVIFLGRWVKRSSNFPVWHPRLVRPSKVRFKNSITGHGETWDVEGPIGYIKSPYIHYSFSKGLDFWFEKHNRLSTMESVAYFTRSINLPTSMVDSSTLDQHRKRQVLRGISYKLPFRPFIRFFYQLFLKGGIFDGKAGWTYCCLYLAYEIMISAKIREKKSLMKK